MGGYDRGGCPRGVRPARCCAAAKACRLWIG
nr:MAG TPA_asm: hypothetical protein [Caudoviricetes sp.]